MLITKIINWIWHSHQCSLSRQVSSSRVVEGMPGIPGVMGNNKHERVHFKWLEEDDQEQYRQTKHWRHYWVLSNEEYINKKCTKMSYLSSLNISAARMKFKLNSRMTPTIQMNFQSDLEFARQFWWWLSKGGGWLQGHTAACAHLICSSDNLGEFKTILKLGKDERRPPGKTT